MEKTFIGVQFGFIYMRNTSTCVEKTTSMNLVNGTPHGKHLHVRGENWFHQSENKQARRNTSTCVEKTLFLFYRGLMGFRNTSTCVEKTVFEIAFPVESRETPPRAWRKPISFLLVSRITRNTSTCVEKTTVISAVHFHKGETPPRAWRKPDIGVFYAPKI